jgi:hypothetical protein
LRYPAIVGSIARTIKFPQLVLRYQRCNAPDNPAKHRRDVRHVRCGPHFGGPFEVSIEAVLLLFVHIFATSERTSKILRNAAAVRQRAGAGEGSIVHP